MSMTTPFNPNYTLSNGLKVVTVDPDPTNQLEPGYIMTLNIEDIEASPAKTIAVLKQTPNAANKVIFDVSEVLRITSPTLVDHATDLQLSGESVKRLRLTTTEVWDGGTNQIAAAVGYVIHGAQQFNQGLLYDNAATNDTFLVELKNVKATPDDIGVVGVQLPSAAGFSKAVIKVYDSANDLLDTFDVPMALVTAAAATRVQFIALYPKNLEAIQPLPTNWSYYTAQVGDDIFFSFDYIDRVEGDSGTVFLDAETIDSRLFELTCPITFEDLLRVDRACELPYKKHRLAFVNNRGGWDYFNFDLNYSETIEVDRQEFTQLYGSWNASTFGYSFQERGRAVYESTTQELVTVSAKVTQQESESLKKLLGSREVQLLDGDQGIPIIIEDTTFPVFHNLDRSKKTLTITFRKSHNILNA